MAYNAEIRIGVTGQNQIDAAVNSINRLQKLIDQVSRGAVLAGADPRRLSAGWDGVANSIGRANRELQQFAQTANRLTQTPQRALPPGRAGGQLAAGGGQRRALPPGSSIPASEQVIDVSARRVATATNQFAQAVQQGTQRVQTAGGGGGRGFYPPGGGQGSFFPPGGGRGGFGGFPGMRTPPGGFNFPMGGPYQRPNPFQYNFPIGPARPPFRVGAGTQRIINSAAIGGGFPLLFGQGAGASVGGLLGGGLGGAAGGAGGFAGGIVGSLIGTQFDKLKQSAIAMAEALKEPTQLLQAMAATGIATSSALANTVTALEGMGRGAEAQALVFKELERLGGSDYVQSLLELEAANKDLQDQWSQLSVTVQKELLPWFVELTTAATVLAKALAFAAPALKAIGPTIEAIFTAANPFGALSLLKNGGRILAGPGGSLTPPKQQRTPEISDTQQRKALDEAIARQKEVLDLQRRGEDLDRAGIDFRRDQEDQIYNLRKKAADYDREVARFRRDIEDKIADKQEENARTLAELTRQRRQNVIEQLDQTLEPAGQISALQGGGRAASVDLAREYIRTIAEGQADLQEKETKSKLGIAKVQRDADRFSLDVADKVKDFSDKAADYAKEVEKFKYETAKKVVDLQRQAADYTYAQWERVYKLAATVAEKNAAAAQNPQGDVSIGQVGASGASIAKTFADALKLTPEQAAGIVGNLQRESGLNPRINEGGAVGLPRGVGGYGLAQFTGTRQDDLIRFAGGPSQAGDLRTQVRFIISELLGPEANALRQLRRTGSPEEAAVSFDRFYERSGIKALGERQANARAVYNQIAKGGATSLPATNTLAAAAPVSFPSARSVAGAAPKAPSALPLTGVPSSLARPDVSKLVGQYKDLNAESVKYLQDLQQTAREAAKLSEIAAKTKLDRANAALSQQFLQPLLDANQALEDRAAYEREYGDLLKNGALPALAEQLANADQLEKTQLRLLELEQSATQEAIRQTEVQLARTDITVEQRKEQEKILAILQGQAAVLDQTRGTIIQQSDQQRGQIQAAESPEARRQRAINRYTERANERNDPNRRLETFLEAKSNLEDLTDPANQIISAANGIGDAFGNAFKDVASGSKSAQEALSDMFTNIGASFLDMAAKILAQQVLFSVLGAFGFGGGLGGGGGGGLLGGIAQTGASAFSYGGSFAGGGYTGSGARSGGIDGMGGFPAILHPQETVVDHTRPSSAVLDTFQGGGSASSDEPIRLETTTINSVEYATVGQVRQASAAAAKQGEARALNRLYSSTSARKRLGM